MISTAETALTAIRKSIVSLAGASVELQSAEDAVRKLQGKFVRSRADPARVIYVRMHDCGECFRAAWWELRQSEIEICEKLNLVLEQEPAPTISLPSSSPERLPATQAQSEYGSNAEAEAALKAINRPVSSLARILAEVEYAQRAVDDLICKMTLAALEPIDEVSRRIYDASRAVRAGNWQLLKAKLESTVALHLHGRCPWCQQELDGWDAADAHVWECVKAEAAFIDPTLV